MSIRDITIKSLNTLKENFNEMPIEAVAHEIDNIIKTLSSPDYILIEWCSEDVIMRAQDLQENNHDIIVPTIEQARDILHGMAHRHDCELGITWTTIDCYLEELKK